MSEGQGHLNTIPLEKLLHFRQWKLANNNHAERRCGQMQARQLIEFPWKSAEFTSPSIEMYILQQDENGYDKESYT